MTQYFSVFFLWYNRFRDYMRSFALMFRSVLILAIVLSFNLFAGSDRLVKEMNYEISYEDALKKAQEQNKPLMMMMGQEGCPWCNKFEVKTLTNDSVHEMVIKNFIPITFLKFKDKGKYPDEFFIENWSPYVLFVNPKSEKSFYKTFGYKSKREYQLELEKALEIFNNQ